MRRIVAKPSALDFFSGSGLVTEGLKKHFDVIWANDICPKKNAIYDANFAGTQLDRRPIEDIKGPDVPSADLAWASFPCQDLSFAGNLAGMSKDKHTRSSLFWEWIRVLDEMQTTPPVLVVENVVGFMIADEGQHFRAAYSAIRERGYRAGAVQIDAVHFVPQSRPRCFLVAIKAGSDVNGFASKGPDPLYHPKSVIAASETVADPAWVWWRLPPLPRRSSTLTAICELDAIVNTSSETHRLIRMLSDRNRQKLDDAMASGDLLVGAGYKRIRKEEDGQKHQRLEIRFDGLSGCLRTPNGGSSRQIVLIVSNGTVKTRLMTVRETARLMGAPETYKFVGSYNDGYRAMGDAVAVPVTRWLSEHLLAPLAVRNRLARDASRRIPVNV